MNPADSLQKLQSILKEKNLSGWNMSMGKYEVDWIKNGVVLHIPTSRGGVAWYLNEAQIRLEPSVEIKDISNLAAEANVILDAMKV